MKVRINPTWDMETLQIVSHDGEYEYNGPVDAFGDKSAMRNITSGQAKANATNSATDRSTETAATGDVNNVANSLMATKPGQLSPWSSANYASNLDNIASTYNNIRGQGFKALGQSGFGSSPGATASLFNTANQNQGVAQTGAYRNALQDTLNQTLTGANMKQGISGQYGAQSQNESGQSVNDAAQRINEGSTLGDVAGGIGTVAGDVLGFSGIGKAISGLTGGAGNNMGGKLPLAPNSTVNSSVYGSGFGNVSPRYANTGAGAY